MLDKSSAFKIVRSEIVKKIRKAPNDEQALKIFETGEALLFEINRRLTPCSQIEKLLRALELEIGEEQIKEILAPFKDQTE